MLSVRAYCNYKGSLNWKRNAAEQLRVRERSEDTMMLALKTEEEATSQEVQTYFRIWNCQENRFSPKPPEGKKRETCQHLDFRPLKPTLEFWLLELYDNKPVLFSTTKFVLICYSSDIIINTSINPWFLL